MIRQLLAATAIVAASAVTSAAIVEDAMFDYSTISNYTGWKSDQTNLTLTDGALVITNDTKLSDWWAIQYMIAYGMSLEAEMTYNIDITLEADGEGFVNFAFGSWDGRKDQQVTPEPGVQTIELQMMCPAEATSGQFVLMQSGDFVGTLKVKSVRVTHEEGEQTWLKAVKPVAYTNPLSAITLCADPTSIEYDGRLYVYGTCDQQEYDYNGGKGNNTYGQIKKLSVFSTADMVNWTHHGEIDMKSVCGSWMAASWAPSIVSRKESDGLTHFYMYFSNSGGGVGVVTATSPLGPWTSPLDHTFITGATPNLGECVWAFDPGVVIDENGVGWLAMGGGDPNSTGSRLYPGNTRIIKLGADMVSIDKIVKVNAPYHLEANELNYIGGKYVLSYSSSWGDRDDWSKYSSSAAPGSCSICYLTSDDPLDPASWKWGGEILKNPGSFGYPWGNNHIHMHKFQGKYYMIYHTQVMEQLAGISGGYRSIAVNPMTVDETAVKISPVTASNTADIFIAEAAPSALVRQQAEMMCNGAGIKVAQSSTLGNTVVSGINNGGWTCVDKVSFGTAPVKSFTARICGTGKMEVIIDKLGTEPVATLDYSSANMADICVDLTTEVSGDHRVFFVFTQADPATRFDEWQFNLMNAAGVDDVVTAPDIVSREYYSVSGVRMMEPKGVCIERATRSDGTVSVSKRVFR